MGLAMHDIYHLVKDIEAHPDTLLVFEVHVKPKIQEAPPKKPPEARGPHNGYPLTRQGELGEGPKKVEEVDDIRWKNYCWSFMPLFNLHDELRAGIWKVPLYKPPAETNVDISNFKDRLRRIPYT